MAIAKGFETLMLKTETKKLFLEAKASLETHMGVHLTHSDALNLMAQKILSDSISEIEFEIPERPKRTLKKPQIRSDYYAARVIVAGIFGEEYFRAPLNISEDAFVDSLNEILNTLTPKESEVLKKRFGFDSDRTHTLQEVGDHFGVSRERIRQIEVKAFRKLRHPARTDRLMSFFDL